MEDPCCALLMVVAAGVQAALQQVPADVSSCQPSGIPLRKPVQAHVDSVTSTWRRGVKRGLLGGHQGAIQAFLASPQDLGPTTSSSVAASCSFGERHHSPDDG